LNMVQLRENGPMLSDMASLLSATKLMEVLTSTSKRRIRVVSYTMNHMDNLLRSKSCDVIMYQKRRVYQVEDYDGVDYEDSDDSDDSSEMDEVVDENAKNNLYVFIFFLSVFIKPICPLKEGPQGDFTRDLCGYCGYVCPKGKRKVGYGSWHAFRDHCSTVIKQNGIFKTTDMERRKAEAKEWFHYAMNYYDQMMRDENKKKLDNYRDITQEIHFLHMFDPHIPDWYISEVRQLREHIIPDCHDDRQTKKDILAWDVEVNTDSKVSK